jgi:uncharacterized protein
MPSSITWTFSLILIFLGLAGMLIPVLPGLPLVYLGTVLHKFAFFTAHPISWTAFWILTGIFIVAQVIELASGLLGAKSAGMNRWGVLGAVLGLVVGFLCFNVPGLILGPLLGLFLGQIGGGQKADAAVRTTLAYAVGAVVGFGLKFCAAILMVGVLFWAVFS